MNNMKLDRLLLGLVQMEYPTDWDKLEDLLGDCSADKAAEERIVLSPHFDHPDHRLESKDR